MNKHVNFEDLGRDKDYQEIWTYQEKILNSIVEVKMQRRALERALVNSPSNQLNALNQDIQKIQTQNYLFFVEHPHVYTLGKSGDEANLLANKQQLEKIKATYIKTNRGGDITYHGPKQLVGYPVLDLDNFKTDIHWYLRSLEEVIIRTLSDFGISGARSKGETGVWLDVGTPFASKICAMGVKASRWITMHGFALNVNTDMRYFEYIIPCGITDKAVTSMNRELGGEVDMDLVKRSVKYYFEEVFECKLI